MTTLRQTVVPRIRRAAGGAVQVATAALLLAASSPTSAQETRVGPNRQVSAPRPDLGHYETRIAAHPNDPDVLLAAAMVVSDTMDRYDVRVYRSPDGGTTWEEPTPVDFGDRPFLAVSGPDADHPGRVYVHSSAHSEPLDGERGKSAVAVFRTDSSGSEVVSRTTRHVDGDRYVLGNGESAVLSDGTLVALDRVRDRLAEAATEGEEEPFASSRARTALSSEEGLERLFVRSAGSIVPVDVDDVRRMEASGDYVRVHVEEESYLVSLSLAELERRLDPDRFLRVHRSHLVNADHIDRVEKHDRRRLRVHLDDGSSVVASRSGSRDLRDRTV